MANKVLAAKLAARITDLEYQIKHGKLDAKIALTALMEETVAECIATILSIDAVDQEWSVLEGAAELITIKD